MFTPTIRSLVMKELNKVVDKVQADYNQQVIEIERECETKKIVARENAVESLMSKFR